MKVYAVHYGNGHLARCKVLDTDFRSLATASKAANRLAKRGYTIIIISDTDGNEWNHK